MTIIYQLRALIAEWLLKLAYLAMPAGVEKGALEKALDQYERDIAAAVTFAMTLPGPE
jgi:predicted benzoate:H+ symporter BenE